MPHLNALFLNRHLLNEFSIALIYEKKDVYIIHFRDGFLMLSSFAIIINTSFLINQYMMSWIFRSSLLADSKIYFYSWSNFHWKCFNKQEVEAISWICMSEAKLWLIWFSPFAYRWKLEKQLRCLFKLIEAKMFIEIDITITLNDKFQVNLIQFQSLPHKISIYIVLLNWNESLKKVLIFRAIVCFSSKNHTNHGMSEHIFGT